jgi:predicted nucleotidyltransferase
MRKTFKEFLAEKEEAKKKSLYVSRPLLNHKDLVAWAKSQGFKSTLPGDDIIQP